MPSTGKNPGNVAGGLKATLHNDRVSDDAKQNAQDRLDRMGDERNVAADADKDYNPSETTGQSNQVLGGYKATLKNPRVSQEAKEHAQNVLDESAA